jgi:large subunit ribosomal protein L18
MVQGPRAKVPFRRRREGKTNFRRRLNLIKSGKPRAVVRSSNKYITVQFVEFKLEGDRVLATATSRELTKFGWKNTNANIPSAYLVGMLAARRALKNEVEEAVLDIGLRVPVKGSKVFAALQGIIDAGVDVPHSDDILPSPERLAGSHISDETAQSFENVKSAIKEMEL